MSGDKNRNLVAALCYALGFVTAIFVLYTEDRDRYIRFNAYQSLYATGSLFLLNIIGGYILAKLISAQIVDLLSIAIWLLIIGICVVGFVNSYQGKIIELPIVGKIAERKTSGI